MHSSNVIHLLAIAGLSMADSSSVTSLFVPGADRQPLLGSVLASNAGTTTYLLQCDNDEQCGFPEPFTLTEAPSSVAYTLRPATVTAQDAAETFVGYIDCTLAGSPTYTAGTCTLSTSIASISTTETGIVVSTLQPEDFFSLQVTLVTNLAASTMVPAGGLGGGAAPSNTPNSAAATSTSASSGTAPSSAAASGAGAGSSGSQSVCSRRTSSSGSGGAATAATPTNSSASASKNGAGQVVATARAQLAVGGAAAAAAVAFALL